MNISMNSGERQNQALPEKKKLVQILEGISTISFEIVAGGLLIIDKDNNTIGIHESISFSQTDIDPEWARDTTNDAVPEYTDNL